MLCNLCFSAACHKFANTQKAAQKWRLLLASLIEDLISTLEKEYEIYRNLLPIAEQKTKIIVDNDLNALQKITEKEQEVVDQITSLEHKREEVVRNIGTVLGKPPESLNVKAVIDILSKQPAEQKRLTVIHANLKEVIQRLIDINNHNSSLIDLSLEMIEFNLNFIQSTRMSPGSSNYTKNASQVNDMIDRRRGLFDARQ